MSQKSIVKELKGETRKLSEQSEGKKKYKAF